MSEDEHRKAIFENLQTAIDAEVEGISQERPGLDHERIKRGLIRIMADYQRSQEFPRRDSDKEFRDGLRQFFSESYPMNEPRAEFEATHEVHLRVMKRMGWEQIADPSGPDNVSEDDANE